LCSLRQFFEYLLQEDASYNRIGHDLGIVVQKVEVVPVWCRKGKRKYFYYKCLVDARRAVPSCPVRQVAAGEVEGLVFRQLQLVLGSPEIRAAVAEVSGLPASDVAMFLGSELWERMTMPERGRLARLLVKEAVLREDGLTMEIRTEGIEALIKEALDETQN